MRIAVVLSFFLLIVIGFAQTDLESAVNDNGGGSSRSSSFDLKASIGKSLVGLSGSGSEHLSAGFLTVLYPREAIDEGKLQIPETAAIGQIYPNPFNSTTQIDVSIPEASEIVLEIFDLFGCKINTVKSSKGAGNWSIKISATKEMAGGVYIYKASAGNKLVTGKMIYVK